MRTTLILPLLLFMSLRAPKIANAIEQHNDNDDSVIAERTPAAPETRDTNSGQPRSSDSSATEYKATPTPIDLMLLIDSSGSMAPRWQQAHWMVARLLAQLMTKTPNLHVGWIYIGKITRDVPVHPLIDPIGGVLSIFTAETHGSSGNAANCIAAAVNRCNFRPGARRILLLIGDDGTVANRQEALAAAKRVKAELGGELYAVVESRDRNYNEMVGQLCKTGGGSLLRAGAKNASAFDFDPDWNACLKP